MIDQLHSLEPSKAEQHQRRLSRRALLRGMLTIGLAVPVTGGLLSACSAPAPAAAPTALAAATQAVPTVAAAAAKVAPTVAAAATQVAPTVAAVATQAAPVVAAVTTQVAPVVSGGGKLQVSILGKEMTRGEVVAGLKTEGEVN